MMIPFNRPSFDGKELTYLAEAVLTGHTAGNGPLARRAELLLEEIHGSGRTLLTTSCTHALELSARLLDLQPGDEVIVPAFTFVSTASAFMWNGAKPIFADVRADTLNVSPETVEEQISDRTRAICIVHYGGVGAEPDRFELLAASRGLTLIEDNAHGLGAAYGGRKLGTFGALSTLSFHETKNVTCGEGGALVVNDPTLLERAEILREKGTNRSKFLRGQVDKYTWVDIGSSWVLSDLLAGVLVGQLERFSEIQQKRVSLWWRYWEGLADWAQEQGVVLPFIPDVARHTGHMFHLRMPSMSERDRFISHMRSFDVIAVFHYQALDASPAARALGATPHCPVSQSAADTLVRLPMFGALSEDQHDHILDAVRAFRVQY